MTPVSAETMRELDSMAVESGISILYLMENAGEAVALRAAGLLRDPKQKRIAVFCGKGNNGGDGLVTALKLAERGFDVRVFLLAKQADVKNEAAVSLRAFLAAQGDIRELLSDRDIEGLRANLDYSLIIDALLGTGFSGSVSGALARLIKLLNSSGVPILAVDVPSGLNATTGEASPIAIKAGWTTSFALSKKGFYKNDGPEHTGELQVANIGFPEALIKKALEFEKNHA